MTLRPVDRVLLCYVGVTSLVALSRISEAPASPWVLAANLLIVLLIFVARSGRESSALAELYPIFILLALYGALDLLAGSGGVTVHDRAVQRWETAIFGGQISREWWTRYPSRWWSSILHADYFSYYLIIPAAPLYFLRKHDLPNLRRVVLTLVTTFVVCYSIFLFFPVAGPYYEFPRPSDAFLDNAPARLVYGVLAGGSAYGAAFPSSHVAGVLSAVLASWPGSRLLAAILAVPSLLLLVGVVYCQMHYGVDVLAGVVVAVAVQAAVSRWSV